jgi:beta-glucanase (GH16 family)
MGSWSEVSVRKKIRVGAGVLAAVVIVGLVVFLQLLAVHAEHKAASKPKHASHKPWLSATMWNGIPQPLGIPGHWRYILDDEFDGPTLDTSIWRAGWYGTGTTGPTNVLENDCYSSANVTFPGDGSMHLAVSAERSRCDGRSLPYSGALVSTNPLDGRQGGGFEYTYGVVQARMYIPGAYGKITNWPALWTDGHDWPYDGEDDVMEGIGGEACFHFHSLHHAPHGPGGCVTDLQPGWHTFASDWQPGEVSYYYDGYLVGTVTVGVTGKPMFIVITNTVWKDEPDLTMPAALRVDYVRVWQRVG